MSEQEPCQPSTINPSWPESPEAYGISPLDSNGMKSDNPHSGFYRADTARTLDLNGGNPACNQGGGTCKESCAESVGPAEREDLRGNRTVSCSERELAGRAEPGRYSRLFGGLPERDGKPICERDPASEGAGTELEQQQRSQSADEVIRGGWHVPDVSHALKAKANCDYREDSETYICTTPPPPQAVAADMHHATLTGETTVTLTANTGQSANHAGPTVLQVGCDLYNGTVTGGWRQA